MQKKNKKVKSKLVTFSKIVWILSIIFMVVLGYFIYDANILPFKYYLAIVVVLVLLLSIHGFLVMRKKTGKGILITLCLLAILFMGLETFAITKINDTIQFLRENLGAHFETNVYYFLVNNSSSYLVIDELNGKDVKTVEDFDDKLNFEQAVKRKADVNLIYEQNVVDLLEQISNDEELIVLVNSGNYEAMAEADEKFESSVRIIGSVEIVTEIEQVDTGINITKEPFAIYLSGIDTRSDYLPSRSLSDVNIILAINPNTRKILMIHIPRDYYVQIHGTSGLKDKLTHSGTLGGIELSMATVEDLLEINIPYYVRVNFNAVVNLVDAIGGIDINSDVNYSFSCWTDRSCVFNPGINSVNGKCALAFARERHAYETGDRHRGENQEQVIELVIDKVTSSSTIINSYTDILNALNGTFQSNLTTDEITSLVKMQLDDMRGWKIESANVDGTGGMQPTYSYPNQNLYVMNPDMESVREAVLKLNEVFDED